MAGEGTAGIGVIRVIAPGPGRCRECADRHDAREAHCLSSLYYMVKFYRKNRRFPDGEDATAHMSTLTRAASVQEKAGTGYVEEFRDLKG